MGLIMRSSSLMHPIFIIKAISKTFGGIVIAFKWAGLKLKALFFLSMKLQRLWYYVQFAFSLAQKTFFNYMFSFFRTPESSSTSFWKSMQNQGYFFGFHIITVTFTIILLMTIALLVTRHQNRNMHEILLSLCPPLSFSLYFKSLSLIKECGITLPFGVHNFFCLTNSDSEQAVILIFKVAAVIFAALFFLQRNILIKFFFPGFLILNLDAYFAFESYSRALSYLNGSMFQYFPSSYPYLELLTRLSILYLGFYSILIALQFLVSNLKPYKDNYDDDSRKLPVLY